MGKILDASETLGDVLDNRPSIWAELGHSIITAYVWFKLEMFKL